LNRTERRHFAGFAYPIYETRRSRFGLAIPVIRLPKAGKMPALQLMGRENAIEFQLATVLIKPL